VMDTFTATLAQLQAIIPASLVTPSIGIVCGSGLSGLADSILDKISVPYADLKGFVGASVPGHGNALVFGMLGGVSVVVMTGRFHPYEGHPMSAVVYPIRLMALLGVKDIIITNAAGGLNPDLAVGTIVVIQDHLALPNLTGPLNALLGPPLPPPFSTRFLPLSQAYSHTLRKHAFRAAHTLSLPRSALAEGTYAWVSGPTYETPAEGRMLRNAGGDVVGMSTVPEVVAAKHAGMEVLVLSLVTNAVVIPERYVSPREEFEAELAGTPIPAIPTPEVSHAEVLEVGRLKAEVMRSLVEEVVRARGVEIKAKLIV